MATEERPRLMIRQMVLENFKSYAGTQYVGPFHKVRRIVEQLLVGSVPRGGERCRVARGRGIVGRAHCVDSERRRPRRAPHLSHLPVPVT